MASWFDLFAPDRAWLQDETGIYPMKRTAEGFAAKETDLVLRARDGKLDALITAQSEPICRITLRFQVSLPEDCRILGDHWERGYGDLCWQGIIPERVMPWYMLLHAKGKTDGIGVMTGCAAMCWWRLTADSLTLCMDVRNGDGGVVLGGRTLAAATLVTTEAVEGQSAYEATRALCKALCESPVMPKEPVYGGNNWYYAYGESTHEQILRDSKFISSLSESKNRPYMVIDDGWQICRNSGFTGGPWHAGNRKFPDMPELAAQMKQDGVKPGIWVRPLLNCVNHPKSWQLPNAAARFPLRIYGGEYDCQWDPTIPEVREVVREDIAHIRDWGYDMIKHDFTTYDIFGRWGFEMGEIITAGNWHFNNRGITNMEAVIALYRDIADAAGDVAVLGCNTISHAAAGIFAVNRTGDDTSGFEWSRTRKMGINTLAFRSPHHGTFYSADADCIGITSKIPWDLNAQWLEAVAKSGTPLFVSVDPLYAGEKEIRALKEAFALAAKENSDCEPLDYLNTTCPSSWRFGKETRRFHWDADTQGL